MTQYILIYIAGVIVFWIAWLSKLKEENSVTVPYICVGLFLSILSWIAVFLIAITVNDK